MKKRINNTDNKNTKNRSNEERGKQKNDDEKDNEKNTIERLEQNEDEYSNQGFGDWLRSNDGAEMMRLFVIANSLLLFVTMAWPNMKESFYFIRDYFMGEEDDY
ncbi:PREDICTED: uncharacterized protein LOC106792960 [Polistes canadensis]|uniref:uncharacterized protein LOC106792960 n=1 Tax=Polistes canadensis TaxID=91411 RepID=UPI0007190534|nr:PREDICTED: uncharacterized protein LOC106792960 [Polistes canadensis]